MATYTVNLSGFFSDYSYATINGTVYDGEGTWTFTSKPSIEVYVSSSRSTLRSNCKVTLNGTTVKSGYGSYTVDVGSADIINIQFTRVASGSYYYFTCDITTETSTPPDPMAPHDGHNTNIGQVAREIEGGTVLIGGVLGEIDSGLVLAGGVAREIAFGQKVVTVTVSGTMGQYGRTTITLGEDNITNTGTYEYEKPLTISVYVKAANSAYNSYCRISLNGTTVQSGSGTYTFTTEADSVSIEMRELTAGNGVQYYRADITTS